MNTHNSSWYLANLLHVQFLILKVVILYLRIVDVLYCFFGVRPSFCLFICLIVCIYFSVTLFAEYCPPWPF